MVRTWTGGVRVALVAGTSAVLTLTGTGTAVAAPPPGGTCGGQWQENTTLVNPQDPDFFATIDKNADGVICIKDFTGPDPDPDIGFLARDNVARHRG